MLPSFASAILNVTEGEVRDLLYLSLNIGAKRSQPPASVILNVTDVGVRDLLYLPFEIGACAAQPKGM